MSLPDTFSQDSISENSHTSASPSLDLFDIATDLNIRLGIPTDILATEIQIDSALQALTSSTTPPPMGNPTNFTIGTLSFAVDVTSPQENTIVQVGRLYQKETRPTVGSQEEKDLIAAVTANQQYDKYQMINVSVKDTGNLKNNLSITKRLQMTHDCWERYDLLNLCNIVFPTSPGSANLEKETDSNGKQVVKFRDLFTFHRRLSIAKVAESCSYYQRYVTFPDTTGETCTFAKEMAAW